MKKTKRNFIKLVDEIKDNGEVVYKTYITPSFIPMRKILDATEILSGNDDYNDAQLFDVMLDFIVDIYQNQFTKEDLLEKLHAPDAINEIESQISFVAEGQLSDERKKELERII